MNFCVVYCVKQTSLITTFLFKVFYKPWVKAKIEYESVGKLLFPNLDELIRIHSKSRDMPTFIHDKS